MARAIELQGAKELGDAFKELGKKVARQFAKDSLKAGAKPIQDGAKSDAPSVTGGIRRGIKIRMGKRRKGEVSVIVTTPSTKATSGAFYTKWVNDGHFTGKRLAKGAEGKGANARANYHRLSLDAGRKFIPGQHFMERAFQSKAQVAADLVVAQLWLKISEQAKL